MSWFKRAPEGAGEDAYLVEAIIGGEAVIVPVLGATSRRDALAICASEFSNVQLPDYAAYKKLTDPPPAFPDSIAEALEELRRKVWAAGYPVGEITIGTTTDYETNEVTLFAEADVIPWKEES